MDKVQIKEFNWYTWDYSIFGNFIYTYEQAPTPIEFYFASPIYFKWGKGEADLIVDDAVFKSLNNESDKGLINIEPSPTKKYSTLTIAPKKGPIVIDEVDFFKNLFTSNSFDSRAVKIGDKNFLTSSFVFSPKKDT